MTQLLSNIKGIINAFYVSAKKDGACPTLRKGELRQLIHQEFADVTVVPQGLQSIEKMLQLLDADSDGTLDFNGFLVLVFQVAKACYREVSQGQRPGHGGSSAPRGEADWGEHTLAPRTPERDPRPRQAPGFQSSEQGLSPHQSLEPQTPERDPTLPQVLEPQTPERDPSPCQAPKPQTPEQDSSPRQAPEPQTPERDPNPCQAPEPQIPELDLSPHQGTEPQTPEQDPSPCQAPEPQIPEWDSSPPQALEPQTPDQDQRPHQALEEAQTPEQDLSHSETQHPLTQQQNRGAQDPRQPAAGQTTNSSQCPYSWHYQKPLPFPHWWPPKK